jgi:NAD-dependent dihydropyrimidine dehydrogenase PreA subunit
MAYEILTAKCTGCGACADECPQGTIAAAPDGSVFRIEPEQCVDCGACAAACPNGAPQPLS